MKRFALASYALSLAVTGAACAISESPVGPTPIKTPAPVITPSVLRATYGPDVFSGGATQVHAAVYGYDAAGLLQRVPDIDVAFVADSGRLTVLVARTSLQNDAAALLEVDRTRNDYTVRIEVRAAGLTQAVLVPVCGCLPAPAPAPSPAPGAPK